VVQLALLRLLANTAILGEYAISAAQGWALLEELASNERVEFLRAAGSFLTASGPAQI